MNDGLYCVWVIIFVIFILGHWVDGIIDSHTCKTNTHLLDVQARWLIWDQRSVLYCTIYEHATHPYHLFSMMIWYNENKYIQLSDTCKKHKYKTANINDFASLKKFHR